MFKRLVVLLLICVHGQGDVVFDNYKKRESDCECGNV